MKAIHVVRLDENKVIKDKRFSKLTDLYKYISKNLYIPFDNDSEPIFGSFKVSGNRISLDFEDYESSYMVKDDFLSIIKNQIQTYTKSNDDVLESVTIFMRSKRGYHELKWDK